MTAFNLCRGPVSGSQSVCVCVYLWNVCVSTRLHSLQSQRASASFSCGCLRVTSTLDPVGQSFYTTALSTLHFPAQHATKPLCSHTASNFPSCPHTHLHEDRGRHCPVRDHKESARTHIHTAHLHANKQKVGTRRRAVCRIGRR